MSQAIAQHSYFPRITITGIRYMRMGIVYYTIFECVVNEKSLASDGVRRDATGRVERLRELPVTVIWEN